MVQAATLFQAREEAQMRKLGFILALLLLVSLAACGGGSEPAPAGGNTDAGEALFAQSSVGSQAGCITCHSLEPGVDLVGPSLANVGAEAGSRVSGQSAEEYLRQSILEPGDYVVDGFGAGIMPGGYSSELSDEQVDDLVAYLLSLE
jgi:mono/diheme cytochrome c family protein